NIPESWTMVDVFPQGLTIAPGGNIGIGNTAGLAVNIFYSVATNPRSTPAWNLLGGGPYNGASANASVAAPHPPPGRATGITALKYVFTAAMPIAGVWQVQNRTLFSDLNDNGTTIAPGTVLQNCAQVTSVYGPASKVGTGCDSRTVTPTIDIQASKNIGA